MREATRYLGVPGRSVHCPDAATLHYASKKSNIPAVAIARVRRNLVHVVVFCSNNTHNSSMS